jgi:hypothetical protein
MEDLVPRNLFFYYINLSKIGIFVSFSNRRSYTNIPIIVSTNIQRIFLLARKNWRRAKVHAVKADGGTGSHSVLRDEVKGSRHVHAQSVLSPVEEISVDLSWLIGKMKSSSL